MRFVFETMGTVASIDVAATGALEQAQFEQTQLERLCAEFDARFSLYEPHSELSSIAAGSHSLLEASQGVLDSYLLATRWSNDTHGWFTPHRPDGVIDLNGVVKAEAIAALSDYLDARVTGDWSVNIGGDILVSAGASSSTGVVDPHDRGSLVAAVHLGGERRAMATSGGAERGDHIWARAGASASAPAFVQVTVVAADIVTADVWATAIIAGGHEALNAATDDWPVDVLAIDRDGELTATPGFVRLAVTA